MGRTRVAALTGALAAVTKYGSHKATMGDIAMLAGIAKATLYNHFRTRDDVYVALVAAEVDKVAAAAVAKVPDGLDVAVAEAARLLGEYPALHRVALDDPGAMLALATPGAGPVWDAARAHVVAALTEAGYTASPAAVDLVLRYLVSQLLATSTPDERVAASALLTAAVGAAPPAAVEATLAAPATDPDQAGSSHTSS
jgi:AcrR family transcriptional regulator